MAAAKRVAVLRDAESTIVPSAVEAARRWRGRWVRNQYHQASSRGVVVCRNRRVGPGSSGMMGSPIFLSRPRDRMGRPVTVEYVADVRRAAAVAVARGRRTYRAAGQISSESKLLARPERPMYVSKSLLETWEGPLRTHRRTARLSIWLVHFWPWQAQHKSCCICVHTEPLGTWVGVTAQTVDLAA